MAVHLHAGPRGSARESLNLLEAFFVGRAFAEVVNERLGEWAADVFAELGKLEAEIRRAQSEFEEEVMQRAQSEMRASAGGSGEMSSRYQTDDEEGSDVKSRGLRIAHSGPADLDEAVDNLRAEIAAARAALQALKRLRPEENRKLET